MKISFKDSKAMTPGLNTRPHTPGMTFFNSRNNSIVNTRNQSSGLSRNSVSVSRQSQSRISIAQTFFRKDGVVCTPNCFVPSCPTRTTYSQLRSFDNTPLKTSGTRTVRPTERVMGTVKLQNYLENP